MDVYTERFLSSVRIPLQRYATYTARNQQKVLLLHALIVSLFVLSVWPFDLLAASHQVLGDSTLVGSSNPECYDRVRNERELHFLPIHIVPGRSDWDTTSGFISKSTLHKALGLQNHFSAHLAESRQWHCVKSSSGSCLVQSPLSYWNASESILLSDPDPLLTWSQQSPYLTNYVARVWSAVTASIRPRQLVLSWPVQSNQVDSDPLGFARDALAEYGTLHTAQSHEQKILFRPAQSFAQLIKSKASRTYLGAYLALLAYVAFVVGRLDRLHSKAGMLCVATISMLSSGLVSLSFCKLLGFSVDAIPWTVLPILVMVLAVDNTYILTRSIVSTPVSLSIPERIGQGVGRVGPQILLALAVEHVLLGLAALCIPVRAVREMLLLSAIALKADAVMQLTFCIPMLSIDMQCLELSDLMRQGSLQENQSPEINGQSPFGFLKNVWHGAKDRLARSVCFLVITTSNIAAYIWYGPNLLSDPPFCADLLHAIIPYTATRPSALWLELNPEQSAAIHLRQHSPLYFTFKPTTLLPTRTLWERSLQLALSFGMRTLLPVLLIFIIEYFVVIYLLRDSEVLVVEKHRIANEKARKAAEEALEKALPIAKGDVLSAFSSADVEKVTMDGQGHLISWAQADRYLRRHTTDGVALTPIPLQNRRSTIVKALVATKQGMTVAYIDGQSTVCLVDSRTGTELFDAAQKPASPANEICASQRAVYSLHKDSSIWKWDVSTNVLSVLLEADDNITRVLSAFTGTDHPAFAVIYTDQSIRIYRDAETWQCISSLEDVPDSQISAITLADVFINGRNASVLAIGTESGHICLYDLRLAHKMCQLAIGREPVQQIRLVQAQPALCPCVQDGQCQSMLMICSAGNEIGCERFFVSPDSRICTCNRAPSMSPALPRTMSSLGLKVVDSLSTASSPEALSAFASSSDYLSISRPRNRKSTSVSSRSLSGPSHRGSDEEIPTSAKTDRGRLQWITELCCASSEPVVIGPPPSFAWELCGGLLVAGLVRRSGVSNAQSWQTFSIDLSNQGLCKNKMRIRYTPVIHQKAPPADLKAFARRSDPLKAIISRPGHVRQAQLPFWRVNDMAASVGHDELVATYGNSLIVISSVNVAKSPVYAGVQ